ncbi:MAG TPA: exopolysaccharide transport family protein, partial [Bryobacteraceae bacterium]|nr:exopolysaccharide transport family protein [Bryobacteraceae bacterium]
MAQYDVDLRDYWRVIRKRKAQILFTVLLVGLCSYGFAKFREPAPLYEAGSAIKIDRFSNLASILTGGLWRQSENMETHAYIITSFPVLKTAVEMLGWQETGQDAVEAQLPPVQRLKRMVEAKPQEGTHIINIRAVSDDGREAAQVANAMAQAYRDYNVQQNNKRTSETRAFIEEQLRVTLERLKQAEQRLQEFKEQNQVLSLDAQTSNTLSRLNVLEVEHERARTERAEIDAQIKALDAAGKGSSDRLMSILMTAAPGSPLEQRRNRIGDLSLKRQGLLVAFTEKHPQVEAVTQEMSALLQEARKDLQLLQQAAAARESELSRRIEQINRENLKLPEKGLVLVRLQREVDLQQSLYSQLKAKYQEVLIQESGKVEEVAVVKPATEPAAPFNVPSKTMIVLTGIVMGLILGVVLVFLTELFDTSMGTIEDVEELLQVPVLGVIPQLGGEGKKKSRAERAETGPSRARDLVTHYEPKSQAAESFRALRTNLQFLRIELKGKLFLITSSFVQEGKTLNAVNLALSMAQAGHRVLLVVLVLSAFTLGVFWQDMPELVPDWLCPTPGRCSATDRTRRRPRA